MLGLLLAQLALRALTELRAAQHEPSRRSGLTIGAVFARRSSHGPPVGGGGGAAVRPAPGEGASGSAAGRLRGGLVAGQVALSFVLMIAATLAVRGLLHLQGIDTGFITIGVQTMRVDLNFSKYREGRSIVAFWQEVERRLRRCPVWSA